MGGVALFPNNPRAVIVVAWPKPDGFAAIDVIARANGSLLRAGASRWAVLATSENPDFVHLLYASGALLVLNGGTAQGCGGPQKNGYDS
jgi:hypothetical protein